MRRSTPPRLRGARPTTAAAVALALAIACDRSPTTPDDGIIVLEIILEGDDGSYSFSHVDHWHGAPVVHENDSVGFTMYFASRRMPIDDHDPVPVEEWFTLEEYPDHNVRVVVEDTTIAKWTGGRVHGMLHGLKAGASRMSFVVQRGTTTLYEAPPLNFRVQTPVD